jgi:Protein of unknown function (DUF1761)
MGDQNRLVKEDFFMKTNYWAVLLAAVAAFIFSSVYYSLLAHVWQAVDPAAAAGAKPSLAKGVIEIARTIVISFVLAHLIRRLGGTDLKSAVMLAFWLWFGFSAMMWVGAIMWEKTPWQVAAIHSGDWLVKTILIAAIISLWSGQVAHRTASVSARSQTQQLV